jgi:hypothetical protein
MSDLSDWRFLPRQLPEPNAPLSRRTQLRLQNMATFTAQRMNTSDGLDPVIQAREEEIECKGRVLVELLKRMEREGI